MGLVEDVHEFPNILGLFNLDDPAGKLGLLVKLDEGARLFALAAGEAVQNDQVGLLRQGAQFFQQAFGGAVEAHVDDGFFLELGGLNEIRAKNCEVMVM